MENLEKKFLEIHSKYEEVISKERATVNTEAYQELETQIKELQEKKEVMISLSVPEKEEVENDYDVAKQDVIDHMNREKVNFLGEIVGKEKSKSQVNMTRLFTVIRDSDLFVTCVSITQKKIKEMEKDQAFAFCKKELKSCIDVIETKVVDLII